MISLLVFLLCSAIMDNISSYNTFTVYLSHKYTQTKKKIYDQLAFWLSKYSYQNKYQLRDWLVQKKVPVKIASWIAKDILVIFSDAWHFFKFLSIIFLLHPVVLQVSALIDINFYLCYIILFMISGIIFNFFFYTIKRITRLII